MKVRKLFAITLALILATMLLCACEDTYETDTIAYVAGTVPEGYLETLTSLEECD